MKKVLASFILLVLLLSLTACGSTSEDKKTSGSNSNSPGVDEILQQEMAKEDAQQGREQPLDQERKAEEEAQAAQQAQQEDARDVTEDELWTVESTIEGVDVDLTAVSDTIAYAQLYDMLVHKEDFIGKVVRLKGIFASFHSEETGMDYYSCQVTDNTLCCSMGLEFVLGQGHGYPRDGEEIVVQGVFDTYEENNLIYCTLRDAVFIG